MFTPIRITDWVTAEIMLTDGLAGPGLAGPGNYAVDIYIDHATGVEIKELVVVDEFAGLWSPVLDEFEYPIVYPISSVSFPNVSDIDDYFYTEGLQPIGFIQVDDHNYTDPDHGGGDNNYTDPVHTPMFPIVRTLMVEESSEPGGFVFTAEILSEEPQSITEAGVLISESLLFDDSISLSTQNLSQDNMFSIISFELLPDRTYYYVSYASNQDGESFGNIKRFRTPKEVHHDNPLLAPPIEEGGWRESHWFGAYLMMDNNWAYHADLGWIWHTTRRFIWHLVLGETYGWLWTNEEAWPFLYSHESSNWIYFLKNSNGSNIFFNYQSNDYEPAHK